MKLPKVGKNRTPKPEGKKPSVFGKIHINNRFLQKNLLSLIVIAVLAIGTGTAYGTLSSRDADRGEDPVYGVNQDRYQVLVSGKGYKLSKQQEKNYKLQKQQNQVNALNDARSPNTLRSMNGFRTFRSTHSFRFTNRYKYNGRYSFQSSKTPRVVSDVTSEINKLDKPVDGTTFNIKVMAYAYPYGMKNAIPSSQISVKVEGGSASLYKSESGNHYYKIELGEGKNTISITAIDKKTGKKATLGPYSVIAEAGKSDNSDKPGKPGNSDKPDKPGKSDKPGKDKPPKDDDPQDPVTKKVSVSANYGSDGKLDLSDNIDENKTLREALLAMGVEFDGTRVTFVPGEYNLDGFDNTLKDYYEANLNDGEEVDEEDVDYQTWLNEVKESMGEGIGKNSPFESTHWEFEQDFETKKLKWRLKKLGSKFSLNLNLVLYDPEEEGE